jgi:hypothetical protein
MRGVAKDQMRSWISWGKRANFGNEKGEVVIFGLFMCNVAGK